MASRSLADEYARNGFVTLRAALSADEAERLRSDAVHTLDARSIPFGLGQALPNAAVEAPAVAHVFHHPVILDAVRTVLEVDTPVFTMEAGVHRNVTGPWHKDLGTHVMPGGYYDCPDPCARDDCRVLKVGVYLQDHTTGGGLRVRPGSHRVDDLARGPEMMLRTRPGDVVLFDARITHRGASPTTTDRIVADAARVVPRARRQSVVADVRRRLNRIRRRPDRVAVFFAFGPPGPMTQTYGQRNLEREQAQTGHPATGIDPALAAAFGAAGVAVLDH